MHNDDFDSRGANVAIHGLPEARRGSSAIGLNSWTLVLFLFTGTAFAQTGTPRPGASATLELRFCHVQESSELAYCGDFELPENPAAPEGRRLSLPIVVLPATGGDPQPDPIFVLAGGPGQAAHSLIPYFQTFLRQARRQRDLVFVDIRGTGGNNRLDCTFGDDLRQAATGFDSSIVDACLDQLQAKADLRFYSTYQAMRDLDQVREALGYPLLNLWGGSYGSRAAMVYQALFPDRTRVLVLDGVAPYEVKLPLYNAREAQRALDLTFAACQAD